ncbi:MAG: M28 family peptidase [Clostridiales bacterium]|nr:M28 family peptidase [Clostridiales bacterium]
MKIFKKIILPIMLVCVILFTLVGCVNEADVDSLKSQLEQLQQELEDLKGSKADADKTVEELQDEIAQLKASKTIADISYDKIKYIDANLSDRDCYSGEQFKATQSWIKEKALAAGYAESAVTTQGVTTSTYVKKDEVDTALSAVTSYTTDGKFYNRSGRNYVEAADGEYVKVDAVTPNIIITKPGKSEKQIIVGAHYDGDGTGDNGSGIALALTTAEKFVNIETSYTIVFVFFTAEEYGCYGSTAYANAMTDEEVANTLYMINLDSLVCGDYCYIYGGVQNDDEKVVTQTEAYDNAMAIGKSLGLDLHSNPWTWDNPAPGYDTPDYASPSTGDWSDHKGFKNRGIKYLYMEATNWEIPGPYNEYDGYGETQLVGMLMNTKNDYLEYIETYFPGRIQSHLSTFAPLLYSLLIQPKVSF